MGFMPKSSAQPAARHPISSESKPRFVTALIIRSASPADSAGDEPSMAALVQDPVTQSRIVTETDWRQDCAIRVQRADQPLALQSDPHRRIAEPAGVARSDNGVAEVEVV